MNGKEKRQMLRKSGALLGICMLAAGCGFVEEPMVIGSLQEEYDRGADGSSGEENGGALFGEMVDAPERYQAEFREGSLLVRADGEIQLPRTEEIRLKQMEQTSFPSAVFEPVKTMLGEIYGVTWVERETEREPKIQGAESWRDEADQLILDYIPSEEGNPSLIWSVTTARSSRNQRNSGPEYQRLYDRDEAEAADRLNSAEAMETQAEKLLADCYLSHYEKRMGRWICSGYTDGTEDWMYWLRYTPPEEGVPLVFEKSSLGDINLTGPYLEITFFEDGTLNDFQLVGNFSETGAEKTGFLLPFESIGQLFEQYVRDLERQRQESLENGGTMQIEGDTFQMDEERLLTVSRVVFEYGFLPKDGEEGHFMLVPIWSFYGFSEDSSCEILLLSIRADDGQVLKKEPLEKN